MFRQQIHWTKKHATSCALITIITKPNRAANASISLTRVRQISCTHLHNKKLKTALHRSGMFLRLQQTRAQSDFTGCVCVCTHFGLFKALYYYIIQQDIMYTGDDGVDIQGLSDIAAALPFRTDVHLN